MRHGAPRGLQSKCRSWQTGKALNSSLFNQQVCRMSMPVSSLISGVEFPPIEEAMSWVRQGPRNRELFNLCQAVPSYPPAPALQEEFARLAGTPGIGDYTNILGLDALRVAHAQAMGKDYKAAISAEQVAITTGCNQAFAVAVMAVAKAGENVVMPAPYYFNHQMWLSMLGIGIRDIPAFSPEANWPDVEKARAAINESTRAILLCTPNNPTGAIYPPDVIAAFFELAREKGLALIVDETYKDFRLDPAPAHGLFNRSDWDDTLIQLYSFSKVYALAGYRLGAIISGPRILHEVAKILDCMTICPPHITQAGVIFALAGLEVWKQEKLQMMAGRLAAIRGAFETPGLQFELVSSGAYFAYVRHPFRGAASKFVAMRLAQEHDVLCLPGSMFGPGQEDYLRFAFANLDGALMQPVVKRLLGAQ
jgi:aspartate/methionine/tyrosine aminotransferase